MTDKAQTEAKILTDAGPSFLKIFANNFAKLPPSLSIMYYVGTYTEMVTASLTNVLIC